MGRFKKLCAVVYLLSCVVALGTFAASLFGPAAGRVEALLDKPAFRIVLAVCLVICALQALWVLLRVIIERPEPDCVRIDAAGEVQVALTAIESVARAAAREEDVLVEEVRGYITGRDSSGVRVAIDAIALIESGLGETCGAIVGILAPRELRIRRIMAREGISEDYARKRMEAQQGDGFFRTHCDYLLENRADDTPEAFQARAKQLFEQILSNRN